MSYRIHAVTSNTIKFITDENYINIDLHNFRDYRKCSEFHFYNEKSNDMIVINDFYRLLYFDSETNQVYKRATQYEFDFWNSIHYPESDNAKVYHYVKNHSLTNEMK